MKTTKPPTGTLAKAKARPRAAAHGLEHLQAHQAMLAAMSAPPVMIVLWAAAWLAGGLIASGGPLALARGWLQAVTGI